MTAAVAVARVMADQPESAAAPRERRQVGRVLGRLARPQAAQRRPAADPHRPDRGDQPADAEFPEARQPRQHPRPDRGHRHRGDGPASRHPDARHRPVGRRQPGAGDRDRRRWSSGRSIPRALVILAMLRSRRAGRRRQRPASMSSAACRIPSSSRWRRSASAGASRSNWRSATPPCAACPRRSPPSAAASTFGIPNSFFVVLGVAAARAA